MYQSSFPQFKILSHEKSALGAALFNSYGIKASYLVMEARDTDYDYQLSVESQHKINSQYYHNLETFIAGFLTGRRSA